jgi:ribose-phosphate pyrophosphokinase
MKRFFLLLILTTSAAWANPGFKLFCGNANCELAQAVAQELNIPLCKTKISRFNDGEIRIHIEESVRNDEIFVIQSTCSSCNSSVNDNIMELYLLIRAMKRASAKSVTAVIPYYGYARQDRKSESRVPISASDVAMLLELAGADHIMAVDLHCGQIQGFFHKAPVDNLHASVIFVPYFAEQKKLVNPVVVSPDAGGVERAKKFIEGLSSYGVSSDLAIIVKQRQTAGVIEKMHLVGSVQDRDIIIVDDICDTAGTLVEAAKELKNKGAKRVFACITHPVFSGPALERIQNSLIEELVVANTIPLRGKPPANVKQISVSWLIAEAIQRTHKSQSLSYLFEH